MKIFVDADACPKAIKEILYRAAKRTGVEMILVANQPLRTPQSPNISTLLVEKGQDVADKRIVELMTASDIVVTADIPLAADVIDAGGHALNPRGELYTVDNIRERLSIRDFMDDLRSSGVVTGGPPPLHPNDSRDFANSLDRLLTRLLRD